MGKEISGILLAVLGFIVVLLTAAIVLDPYLLVLCFPTCYFITIQGGIVFLLLIFGIALMVVGYWLVSRGTKTHEKVEYTGG